MARWLSLIGVASGFCMSPLRKASLVRTTRHHAVERPPYALSGLPRPKLRGALMGYLHKSRAWYIVAGAYAMLTVALGAVQPMDIARRLGLIAASSASVAISDGYHNPDLRGAVEAEEELGWLRLDYVSISAMLSTNYWLWASNLGLAGPGAALSAASTVAIVAASVAAVPRRAGHIFVKLTLAFQFVALLGYLACMAAISPFTACCAIYFCYLPGFILYATKWPKHPVFGYHEIFHVAVLLGHLLSMVLDLVFLSSF